MVCSEVVMFETVNDKMSVLFVDLIFITAVSYTHLRAHETG